MAANRAKHFIVPVFIPHAGCHQQCLFCDQSHITVAELSTGDSSAIKTQIENFLGYRRIDEAVTEIAFYGGTFLGLALQQIKEALTIAADYVYRGAAHGIRFSTRPDTITADRLAVLDDYPVTTIELGVQSLNDEVLRLNRRGHTAADTFQAVTLLRGRSTTIGLQMMIGMPGQTSEDAIDTGRRLAELAPDFVRIYPLVVLRESPLEQWYRDGRYTPMDLQPAVELTRDLYRIFTGRSIPVIRMGLQPTTELAPGAAVLAGPFHPAFGELVLAAVWLDRLRTIFRNEHFFGSDITMEVAPQHFSAVRGQKNSNMKALQQEFALSTMLVKNNRRIDPDTVSINGQLFNYSAQPR
jgi:histone acetyltransferase (RNA polymerase elongator complex component)